MGRDRRSIKACGNADCGTECQAETDCRSRCAVSRYLRLPGLGARSPGGATGGPGKRLSVSRRRAGSIGPQPERRLPIRAESGIHSARGGPQTLLANSRRTPGQSTCRGRAQGHVDPRGIALNLLLENTEGKMWDMGCFSIAMVFVL